MSNKTESTKKKKTAYLSMNMKEFEVLKNSASFEGALMYVLLKKLGNFKTGKVKGFKGHKITYQELADDLTRQPSQGVAPIVISRQQARDIINRLVAIGLVCDVASVDGDLTMMLPLSPMKYLVDEGEVETEFQSGSTVKISATKQKSKQQHAAIEDDFHSGFDDIDDDTSVLVNKINTNNNLSTHSGEGFPSPAVASNIHPHPLDGAGSFENQNPTHIYESLLKRANFAMTELPLSRDFYATWAKAGVRCDEVIDAVRRCEEQIELKLVMRKTPYEVHKILEAKTQMKGTGRGRVSL